MTINHPHVIWANPAQLWEAMSITAADPSHPDFDVHQLSPEKTVLVCHSQVVDMFLDYSKDRPDVILIDQQSSAWIRDALSTQLGITTADRWVGLTVRQLDTIGSFLESPTVIAAVKLHKHLFEGKPLAIATAHEWHCFVRDALMYWRSGGANPSIMFTYLDYITSIWLEIGGDILDQPKIEFTLSRTEGETRTLSISINENAVTFYRHTSEGILFDEYDSGDYAKVESSLEMLNRILTFLPTQAFIAEDTPVTEPAVKPDVAYRVLDARIREWGGPAYATPGSAAIDLRACIDTPIWLLPEQQMTIRTGISVQLTNPGLVGIIAPRSGMGSKGLVLGNTVGIIDSDYQGELLLCIWNRNEMPGGIGFIGHDTDLSSIHGAIQIKPGDKIAQYFITPVVQANFVEVAEFAEVTERGAGGFNSTGSQ